MNNIEIFGEREGMKFAEAVAEGYIIEPVFHLVRPSDYEEGDESFGTLEDKVKFIQEAFQAHKNFIKSSSCEPDKIGAKILIKCSGVPEMWELHTALIGTIENVVVCGGASSDKNISGYNTQGKHYINNVEIKKRDDYLKRLKSIKPNDDAIVLHYDILSEGINVNGFTGVMFLSGLMLTVTKICQNIGRATRLHDIDRKKLLNKIITILQKNTSWIKPYCAVIVPYWNTESKKTENHIARIVEKLRTDFGFTAKLEVTLGNDKGMAPDKKTPPSQIEEEPNELELSLVDEVEQLIDGITVNNIKIVEGKRVDKLSDDDYLLLAIEGI